MAKILVMDDEAGFRTVIQSVLKPYNHDIYTAEDGRQALEIAARERPDIAFLDIRVPGSDGVEVLAQLKKLNPAIKCIMLSGFADSETAGEALKMGAFDFLKKPFKIDDVLKAVEKALKTNRVQNVPVAISPGAASVPEASVEGGAAKAGWMKSYYWAIAASVLILAAAAVYFLYFG